MKSRRLFLALLIGGVPAMPHAPLHAQQGAPPPVLRIGQVRGVLHLDGRLNEAMWADADSVGDLTQSEPVEGAAPSARTVVRVLATSEALIVGIRADDAEPTRLVSFARERDANLSNEDHLKLVLDTYRDGRSGYVFAVNPHGARYDALVSGQGENENSNWDAVWEVATARTTTGWSAEFRIPVRSLQFQQGLREWGFNVQRRIQRLQETDRWASPERNFKVTQTFRAGRLTAVPEFALGVGLSVRPSLVARGGIQAPGTSFTSTGDASLDVTQVLGANTLAAVTINTDFAETEVDSRRTNLTRFPIVFPEKRTFFLQGADIFDFGLGTGDDVRPFFSRRIGLLSGDEVPIRAGLKVSGRARGANFGALVVHTGDIDDGEARALPRTASTMGVLRLRQNVLKESSVGVIGSFGDPLGRADSWTAGADATYQTSRLLGGRNLLLGVWGLAMGRDGMREAGRDGRRTAYGGTLDFPNDLWDVSLTYRNVGDAFDPSLGFIPRPGVQGASLNVTYKPRPAGDIIGLDVRQMFHELRTSLVGDLDGRWESYRIFTAPVNWRLESGDRFELNVVPVGERLPAQFTIADGVTIPIGSYHWRRYRLEAGLAPKRRVSGQATWWTGGFYTGRLDEVQLTAAWKPSALVIVELDGTRNMGRLAEGRFTQDLFGTRVRLNVSPDLQVNSYLQYDNSSDSFGANTRLRWTFSPLGDLFIVYNHNLRHDIDPMTGLPLPMGVQPDPMQRRDRRWGFGSNQLLVKLQYAVRY
ncbi:MAG: carbohydrate binding family 9 domain-containing protein [Gemmatimonadetes bacterium]|nr:carbohydrate binding family 9 domain-containing protein [Gemmatimonadota bacterium]MCC6771333.1 carbohydrate binding family 9 domain-containing protein [Gemmatimonadaceae bacterium]